MEKQNSIVMPSFTLENIPHIRIQSIRFQDFRVFKDYTFDFTSKDGIKEFICFIGPNGTGKSTVLNAIQLLFSRLEGREIEKIKANLGKAVRHIKKDTTGGVYGKDDFLITAKMSSSLGDYEIQINKSGFIKDHPKEIKEIVYRLCYFARFDQELNRFQLSRDKWPVFKELFESVTGYKIKENKKIGLYLSGSSDESMKNLIENYVLSFYITKPNEIICEKECSDGEKKIIKSFSTLLTLEYMPQIILVDNIEMHVEKKRHMALISAMKKCFPDSQIFSTTHSYYLSKVLGKQAGIEDLRLVWANTLIKKEPWRLRVIDELEDNLVKLNSFIGDKSLSGLIKLGEKLLAACYCKINDLQLFKSELTIFLEGVPSFFVTSAVP